MVRIRCRLDGRYAVNGSSGEFTDKISRYGTWGQLETAKAAVSSFLGKFSVDDNAVKLFLYSEYIISDTREGTIIVPVYQTVINKLQRTIKRYYGIFPSEEEQVNKCMELLKWIEENKIVEYMGNRRSF